MCKFFDFGFECVNSVLETVTKRSLLEGEVSQKNFKRFEFELKPSITRLCICRKEPLFLANIFKHPDYADIDRTCLSQNS